MSNHELTQLIGRVLDGEGTPHDRARLDALRAEDAGVDRLYEDLASTNVTLRRLPMVEPPPHLAPRIMAALPSGRHERTASRQPGWFAGAIQSLGGFIQARPAFALAYATVLGAVVGIGVFIAAADGISQPHGSDTFGTMASPEAIAAMPVVDAQQVSGRTFTGATRLQTADEHTVLMLEFGAAAQISITVEFDPDVSTWDGLLRQVGAPVSAVYVEDGRLRLELADGGSHMLTFAGRQPGTSFGIEVQEDGAMISRHTLSLAAR